MKRTLQVALPIAILLFAGLIVWRIIATAEEPERRQFQPPSPEVVVRPLEPREFQVTLRSQGTVNARTQSSLIPEVRGRIIEVSPNFQEGAFFEKGDVLLEIDDRDYQTELVVAKAALAQAELNLMEEEARYQQASRDWERLNPDRQANELTLREPQLRQARAAVASAEARVETAQLNLDRTRVTAPYAGRILTKSVDVGQFVTTGTELAWIYAVDFAEVRLPLTASQYEFLNLPSVYRGADPSFKDGPKVTLSSSVGGNQHSWVGRVVRSEGSVDTRSRQIFVVAQVENPYGHTVPGRPPLKVGTFVEAAIEGRTLENVFVVPRRVYRENSYVLVVDQEGNLDRREVSVVWENDKELVVRDGLQDGDMLCLTDVPYALEGLTVVAMTEAEAKEKAMMATAGGAPGSGGAGAGQQGSYPEAVLGKFGDKLPAPLREGLMAAKDSSDWTKVGAIIERVKEWADANGETMPPRPNWGGAPRS